MVFPIWSMTDHNWSSSVAMSVVADLTVEAESFVLGHALQEVPDIYVEGERMVTHSDERVLPFLSATGGPFDRFERAVRDDETVAEFSLVDSFEGTNRYRFVWDEASRAEIRNILDQEAMILAAAAKDDTWRLEIQFTDREQLSDLQATFDDRGDGFSLERLCEPDRPGERASGPTDEQREALLLAHEMGYFSVPRETSTAELADRMGISPGAVSERLRRGSETLVEDSLGSEVE